ncbi:ER mannosidase 1 [Hyphodiscus hymeniophilus]|uniref:alpha-1,2-Mannosidase n=1 Tax=Hyphodiscus hymeniophilus TaxID=353542 RepID=A0A9P6SQ05_9HELO|nr:ER mannosidase 1 [Hyphodiscus hymeniophilus]
MLLRRSWSLWAALTTCLVVFFYRRRATESVPTNPLIEYINPTSTNDKEFDWAKRPLNFPLQNIIHLPNRTVLPLPRIQYAFKPNYGAAAEENERRREMVKSSFIRTWEGYKNRAWLKDELRPISGASVNGLGGWAATLVDSLDTLWIMDLKVDFAQAVGTVEEIDFTRSEEEEVNVFETTIRHLGGLLAARDLCGETTEEEHWKEVLTEKAVELGSFLYAAFDTPNRMPITRWKWKNARDGKFQEAYTAVLLAEIGSMSVEFTRLSQLTGNPKFYDAIQRVTNRLEKAQELTSLPGLWPVVVSPMEEDFGDNMAFSIGAMADSTYEYLLKEYIMLGGRSMQYREMYNYAMDTAREHLFFRPRTISSIDILISGNRNVLSGTSGVLDPVGQHLSCFAGGMLAIGFKVFDRPDDLDIARKLLDGCLWAYRSMPTGIMPEIFHLTPCPDPENCAWVAEPHSEDPKNFPEFFDIEDKRYILRPEAIESLFVLYRITGDETLRDEAWKIFEAIEEHTKTESGNAALSDVTRIPAPMDDSMETFWTGETLKYFYLIFSAPDLISLDEWVFNTEAHPLKRS